MKKLVSLLLVACMCLSIGIMFASCNNAEHTHTYKTDWSKDTTHHWHSCDGKNCAEVADKAEHTWNGGEITTPSTAEADGIKVFSCVVCGQTKNETVDTAVTEEEWDCAFADVNNVTFHILAKLYQSGVAEPDVRGSTTKITELSVYTANYDADNRITMDTYFVEKDNNIYQLQKQNDNWVVHDKWSTPGLWAYNFFGDTYLNKANCFKDKYHSFTYDSKNGCYTSENFEFDGTITDTMKVYIENGKLVKLEFESAIETNRMVGSFTFSDYGTTVIDVPEWTDVVE